MQPVIASDNRQNLEDKVLVKVFVRCESQLRELENTRSIQPFKINPKIDNIASKIYQDDTC